MKVDLTKLLQETVLEGNRELIRYASREAKVKQVIPAGGLREKV